MRRSRTPKGRRQAGSWIRSYPQPLRRVGLPLPECTRGDDLSVGYERSVAFPSGEGGAEGDG